MPVQDLTIQTPTAAAFTSDEIVVDALPVTIFMYSHSGTYPSDFQAKILRKIGTGGSAKYQPAFGPEENTPLILRKNRLEWTAYSAGVFVVEKGVTAYALGVGTDTAS